MSRLCLLALPISPVIQQYRSMETSPEGSNEGSERVPRSITVMHIGLPMVLHGYTAGKVLVSAYL